MKDIASEDTRIALYEQWHQRVRLCRTGPRNQ